MQEIVESILGADLASELRTHFRKVVSKHFDKLMLVTRKGYWIYQEIMQAYQDTEILSFENIYSDRYLLKALDDEWVKGQRIFLMDDTMNHGYSIFRFFCILRKKQVKEVVPIVFALSTEYPQKDANRFMTQIFKQVNPEMEQEQAEKEAAVVIKEFYDKLYCGCYMSPEGIGDLCVKEMELFQRTLCPMSIDLPVIVSNPLGGNVLADNFTISKETFRHLCSCEGESSWQYVNCGYVSNDYEGTDGVVHGKVSTTIQCSYFEFRDELVSPMFDTFLQNTVVKCKYNIDENGNYHAIFTPFAIVRSWKKQDLQEAVCALVDEENEYRKLLLQKLGEENSGDSPWVAALRSVIYILSLYVGEKFRAYLSKNGIEAGYDRILIRRNSEAKYIEMMKSFEKADVREEGRIDKAVARFSAALKGKESQAKETKREERTNQEAISDGKRNVSLQDAYYNCIWRMLQEKEGEERIPGVISLENIEEKLLARYEFPKTEDFRRTVTGIMLMMLENSSFGNMVEVHGDDVVRGFRRGENSQLLIAPSAQISYSCAEILYVSAGEEEYHSLFDDYFAQMDAFIKCLGLLKNDSDRESFQVGKEWFKNFSGENLGTHIDGKRFLLKNLSAAEEKVREFAKRTAHEMVVKQSGYQR